MRKSPRSLRKKSRARSKRRSQKSSRRKSRRRFAVGSRRNDNPGPGGRGAAGWTGGSSSISPAYRRRALGVKDAAKKEAIRREMLARKGDMLRQTRARYSGSRNILKPRTVSGNSRKKQTSRRTAMRGTREDARRLASRAQKLVKDLAAVQRGLKAAASAAGNAPDADRLASQLGEAVAAKNAVEKATKLLKKAGGGRTPRHPSRSRRL